MGMGFPGVTGPQAPHPTFNTRAIKIYKWTGSLGYSGSGLHIFGNWHFNAITCHNFNGKKWHVGVLIYSSHKFIGHLYF